MESTSMRVCSSGMVISPERIPASTCAKETPACRAARPPASVEFVSPKTTAASGRSRSSASAIPGSIASTSRVCASSR